MSVKAEIKETGFEKLRGIITQPLEREENEFFDPWGKNNGLYEPRLGNMIILSLIIHFLFLSFLFFIYTLRIEPQMSPVPQYTAVRLINLNDLPGNGGNGSFKSLTTPIPGPQKGNASTIPEKPMPFQKKSKVKSMDIPGTAHKKLVVPLQAIPAQEKLIKQPLDADKIESVRYAQPGLEPKNSSNIIEIPRQNVASGNSENEGTSGNYAPSSDYGEGVGVNSGRGGSGSGGSGRGSGIGAGGQIGGNNYLALVRLKIDQNKNYPGFAKVRQIQGTVIIHFVITLEGTVKAMKVIQSSGYRVLDEAGLKAIKDAAPFPKPPDDFFKTDIYLEVPIVFELT